MLYDPERRWLDRAICRKAPDADSVFFAPNGNNLRRAASAATQEKWDEAKAFCTHCPAFKECRRDTLGEEYGVWGGYDEHQRYLIRRSLAKGAWKKWPEERRLAWGEHLIWLRGEGLIWKQIQLRTGLTYTVCEGLIAEWVDHVAQQQAETVVDLPPAEPFIRSADRREFPTKAGTRDAWVRHPHLVADAFYGGQTEDGEWMRMLCYSGHGSVAKWFRRTDVKFYNSVRPYFRQYVNRPADSDDQEGADAAA